MTTEQPKPFTNVEKEEFRLQKDSYSRDPDHALKMLDSHAPGEITEMHGSIKEEPAIVKRLEILRGELGKGSEHIPVEGFESSSFSVPISESKKKAMPKNRRRLRETISYLFKSWFGLRRSKGESSH